MSQEGNDLPVALRCRFMNADAAFRPGLAPGYPGGDAAFIEEHHPGSLESNRQLSSSGSFFEEADYPLTRNDQPHGCMLTLVLQNCSPGLGPLRDHLDSRRTATVDAFELRWKITLVDYEIHAENKCSRTCLFF